MDQKYNKKDRHVLTIIAGILCGLHLSAFITYLIFIFILRVEISPQLLLVIILIGILGIVIAITANKEKQGKLRIVFILINAFLLMPGSLVYLFGDLALSSSNRNEQLDREIRNKATIEYIQNAVPEKRLPLSNLESYSSGFAYYDYDGEVAKYFKSILLLLMVTSIKKVALILSCFIMVKMLKHHLVEISRQYLSTLMIVGF